MKRSTVVAGAVFVIFFAFGMLTGAPTAECRQCNVKSCFHESACGRLCTCVFPGGRNGRDKGICVQVGD